MRIHGTEPMRNAARVLSRNLALRLLMAAMLSPVVARVVGWPVNTPLDVPLAVHAVILSMFALAIRFESRRGRGRAAIPRASWAVVPALAIAFAALLQTRSNVFYTARALMEGMAVLLILELCFRELRRRALVHGMRIATPDVPLGPPPGAVGEWHSATALTHAPSIRLADQLTAVLGWAILASWALIALEHRHVVGPLLVLAGALQVVAIVVLIPDALVRRLSRASSRAAHRSERPHRKYFRIALAHPAHSPQRTSVYRRLACHLTDLRLRGRAPTGR